MYFIPRDGFSKLVKMHVFLHQLLISSSMYFDETRKLHGSSKF